MRKTKSIVIGEVIILLLGISCSTEKDPCERICWTGAHNWTISLSDCDNPSTSITNAHYDNLGRLLSYSFTIQCGSKFFSGSVTLAYSPSDNSDNVATRHVTINGQNCF